MFQNIDIIESYDPKFIVLLAGDHIYKMDYEPMLQQHVDQGADVTVGCLEVARAEASGFGVMAVDANNVIHLIFGKAQGSAGDAGPSRQIALQHGHLCVRGEVSLRAVATRRGRTRDPTHDFGKDIVPYIVTHGRAVAHHFSRSCVRSANEQEAYWRDVGTVDAYWAANIDLTDFTPHLDLYDRDWPIWTYGEITPPAKFVHDQVGRRGQALSSLVSGGCIISGATLRRTLLFTWVRVNSYASVENAVILPYVDIGRSARLTNVVVDRGVRIPPGLVVGEDPALDAQRFRRTDQGICLITQPMIDRLSQ